MAGALDGTRVVDFGHQVSGPLMGMILADHGADVVKVGRPGTFSSATPADAILQRGKRCVELDLTHPKDRDLAVDLVRDADLLVENFRPGAMTGLGLGYTAMAEINPGLLYCSLPGFRATSPEAELPGWEPVLAAVAGSGLSLDRVDRALGRFLRAYEPTVPIASTYAALLGTVTAVAALASGVRGGAHLEIAGLNALLTAIGYQALTVAPAPPEADLNAPSGGRFDWHGLHECGDGRFVFFHVGSKLADDYIAALREIGGVATADITRQEIDGIFRGRTAREWEDLGDRLGAEVSLCRSPEEWMREPHAREARLIVDVDDPVHGRITQTGTPAKFLGAPEQDPPRPRRLLDASTLDAEAFGWFPRPRAAVGRPGSSRPLEGIRVLDLTVLIAGPTCARVLSDLGAEVTRFEGPPTVPVPQSAADNVAFDLDVNRGKERRKVDLKSDDGREEFWRLVREADVLVENFRTGVADRLGVGYDAVREANPRIVYTSLTMLGSEGRWSHRPGHDFVAQAMTGMAAVAGSGPNGPRVQNVRAINDYASGILGSLATVLALRERQRTGVGRHVSTSLCEASTLHQLGILWETGSARGWSAERTSGPGARIVGAADGWLAVVLPDDDPARLAVVEGLHGMPEERSDAWEFVETRLAAEPADLWEARLAAAGITALTLRSVDQTTARTDLADYRAVQHRSDPVLGTVTSIGPLPAYAWVDGPGGAPR